MDIPTALIAVATLLTLIYFKKIQNLCYYCCCIGGDNDKTRVTVGVTDISFTLNIKS